jgi:N-dimethylarginine dimethylaminohydrolase
MTARALVRSPGDEPKDDHHEEQRTLPVADPRFYHMDTALCPLPHGEVMYVPQAFTRHGLAFIRDLVEPTLRIELGVEDASQLAANTVASRMCS